MKRRLRTIFAMQEASGCSHRRLPFSGRSISEPTYLTFFSHTAGNKFSFRKETDFTRGLLCLSLLLRSPKETPFEFEALLLLALPLLLTLQKLVLLLPFGERSHQFEAAEATISELDPCIINPSR